MSGTVVAVTAILIASAAAALARPTSRLAGVRSRWTHPGTLALLGAIGGAWAGAVASTPAVLVALAALALGTALLAAVDLVCHRLPDRLAAPTAGVVLAALTVEAVAAGAWADLVRAVGAGAAVGMAFLLLALASPRALGLGDVKLAALLGLGTGWFGWTSVLAGVVGAFLLGGAVALALLLTRRATRATAIPFGPWLVLGAAGALVLTTAAPTL